jgi:hypothetical protein
LPPAAAEYSYERYLFTSSVRGFAAKDFIWGCVKRVFTALRAELYFERGVIFTISRSEIVKMTPLSEEYSAAEGGKNLFTQPQRLFLRTATC